MRALVFVLVACAACGGGQSSRSATQAGPAGASRPSATAGPSVTIALPAPASDEYTTEPTTATASADEEQLESLIQITAVQTGNTKHVPALVRDGRLDALAAWALTNAGKQRKLEATTFEEGARRLGLYDPVPHYFVLGLEADAGAELADLFSVHRYTHYGLSVLPDVGGVAVVLSMRFLTLSPLPRQIEPGRTHPLRGTLRTPYRKPQVIVTHPDGRTEQLKHAGREPEFRTNLPGFAKGIARVEVLASGEQGPEVLANVPLYVGTDAPESMMQSEGTTPFQGDFVAEVHSQLNAERRRQGLAPVKAHQELASVSESHSRDMVANNFVAHHSPNTGTPAQRVTAAGLRFSLVMENIARAYSPTEVVRGLMDSPGHRAAMIHPDVTHVGIGMVEDPESERPAYLVTLLFARILEELDVEAEREKLRRSLNARRRRAKKSPIAKHASLDGAAQWAAEAFFRNPKTESQRILEKASNRVKGFRHLEAAMVLTGNPANASDYADKVVGQGVAVGIGLAQGTRADTEDNAINVVLIFGTNARPPILAD